MSPSEVPFASITLGPNVRRTKGDIAALAASIKEHGLIHPLRVRTDDWESFDLVAGFRRHAAITRLREESPELFVTVPVTVAKTEDNERDFVQISENLARRDLTTLEFADGVTKVRREFGWPVKEVATKLGVHQSRIYRAERLSEKASPKLRTYLEKGIQPQPPDRALFTWSGKTHAEQDKELAKWLGQKSEPTKRAKKSRLTPRSVSDLLTDLKVTEDPHWEPAIEVLKWLLAKTSNRPVPKLIRSRQQIARVRRTPK